MMPHVARPHTCRSSRCYAACDHVQADRDALRAGTAGQPLDHAGLTQDWMVTLRDQAGCAAALYAIRVTAQPAPGIFSAATRNAGPQDFLGQCSP